MLAVDRPSRSKAVTTKVSPFSNAFRALSNSGRLARAPLASRPV